MKVTNIRLELTENSFAVLADQAGRYVRIL